MSLTLPGSIINGMLLDFGHMFLSPFFRALTQDEMWYAEEVSVSCAATTTGTSTSGDTTTVTHTVTGTSTVTEDDTGTMNGAKTLTCWGIGMAIYSWLF